MDFSSFLHFLLHLPLNRRGSLTHTAGGERSFFFFMNEPRRRQVGERKIERKEDSLILPQRTLSLFVCLLVLLLFSLFFLIRVNFPFFGFPSLLGFLPSFLFSFLILLLPLLCRSTSPFR
ncbi:hypothetical protein CSUI_005700 [Cystoisospora suis]|uniref:Transmembrane protein n=1 Tax=Cystoisospora suis TaxID=483139 RepID=A0A2C6KWP7_9APIC|nr:hypothetical protein CSUI_005700 [Cystoisospora suis]